MLACGPDSGNMTPTFSGAPCARPMLNGAVPARIVAAPAPAAKLRRLTRVEAVGDLRVIRVLPRYGGDTAVGRCVPYFSYCSTQVAMGRLPGSWSRASGRRDACHELPIRPKPG